MLQPTFAISMPGGTEWWLILLQQHSCKYGSSPLLKLLPENSTAI